VKTCNNNYNNDINHICWFQSGCCGSTQI